MQRRTLIIHAGGGKAGSSALQSALSRGAADLAQAGITYADAAPISSPYEITSGNGFRLFEQVGEPDWAVHGRAAIEFLLGANPVGICSSEFLGSLPAKRWRAIIEMAEEAGVKLQIVYFVRSALGYITSSYHQNVKRSGEYRPLVEVAAESPWQHYDELLNLEAIFDREQLCVINYDLTRKDIGESFCNAFPEVARAKKILKGSVNLPVNRSLTGPELEVMCQVNAQFGDLYSHELSDRLIYDAPDLQADVRVATEVADIIRGKFADATKWINNTFFPDSTQALSLEGVTSGTLRNPDPADRPLSIALAWALDTIATRGADISFMRRRLLAIDWSNSRHSAVPLDFDPVAYLLLNPDVMRAELAPYSHFIESGHRERRNYRWPLNLDPSIEAPTAEAIAKFRLDDTKQLAETPLWPRLRHVLQLESLLHEFAEREHEYLELIRKLREGHGYESEQFRQLTGKLIEPLYHLLEGLREEATEGSKQRAAEARMLQEIGSEHVRALEVAAANLNARIARLSEELPAVIAQTTGKQMEPLYRLVEGVRTEANEGSRQRVAEAHMLQEVGSEHARALEAAAAGLNAGVAQLAERLAAEIGALREEQAELNAALERKDAELERYRQMGLLKFLRSRR